MEYGGDSADAASPRDTDASEWERQQCLEGGGPSESSGQDGAGAEASSQEGAQRTIGMLGSAPSATPASPCLPPDTPWRRGVAAELRAAMETWVVSEVAARLEKVGCALLRCSALRLGQSMHALCWGRGEGKALRQCLSLKTPALQVIVCAAAPHVLPTPPP